MCLIWPPLESARMSRFAVVFLKQMLGRLRMPWFPRKPTLIERLRMPWFPTETYINWAPADALVPTETYIDGRLRMPWTTENCCAHMFEIQFYSTSILMA